jgi:beta-lactamase regulating signal transducer with metallopeptidase domain
VAETDRGGASIRHELLKGAATAALLLAVAAAFILAICILFVVFEVNRENAVADAILSFGERLAGPLADIFERDSLKAQTVINYGIAAGIWLVGGFLAARVLRAAGGPA